MNRKTEFQLFRQQHIARLGRLLDMLYKPAEIAAEIGVNKDTVYRSYLPAGLPHTRDSRGNIWIHGLAFQTWVRQVAHQRRARRHPMQPDQAWCMPCNGPVQLREPRVKIVNHYLELLQAPCPVCGKLVNRARARVKTGEQ